MSYLHLDKLTPGNLGVFLIGVVLAWFLYNATKHLLMGLVCLVIAVLGAGYATGVISPEKAIEVAKSAGKTGLEAAESEAKLLGDKARESADKATEN